MVRPKLSFDVEADKVKAIADYVCTHVSKKYILKYTTVHKNPLTFQKVTN